MFSYKNFLAAVAVTCIWEGLSGYCFAVTPHPGFDVTLTNGMIVVSMVYADTPADVLGIQKGDVIVSVNNTRATMEAIQRVFSHKHVGSDLQLGFQRGNEIRSMAVRLIDKDNPDSWEAAAELVRKRVLKDYRDEMDGFMAKHGPVRILDAALVIDGEQKRIAIRIANVSEHFLEECELEVLVLDADGHAVRFPNQDDPMHIYSTREIPPANPAGTHGIIVVESKQGLATEGATTAVVTVKHARLANGQDYKPKEPQKVLLKL